MVVFAIELDQFCIGLPANLGKAFAQELDVFSIKHGAAVFCNKDQMSMQ